MDFFKIIKELATGMDITVRIKEKNGKLTVGITPEIQNSSRIVPLVMTGTPEELDEGFMDNVAAPLGETKTQLLNLELHKKSIDEHVEEEKEEPKKPAKPAKPAAKKSATKKKAAPKKKADKKPDVPDSEDIAPDEEDQQPETPQEEEKGPEPLF